MKINESPQRSQTVQTTSQIAVHRAVVEAEASWVSDGDIPIVVDVKNGVGCHRIAPGAVASKLRRPHRALLRYFRSVGLRHSNAKRVLRWLVLHGNETIVGEQGLRWEALRADTELGKLPRLSRKRDADA